MHHLSLVRMPPRIPLSTLAANLLPFNRCALQLYSRVPRAPPLAASCDSRNFTRRLILSHTVPPHARDLLRRCGPRTSTRLWSSCAQIPTTPTTSDFSLPSELLSPGKRFQRRARLRPREASRLKLRNRNLLRPSRGTASAAHISPRPYAGAQRVARRQELFLHHRKHAWRSTTPSPGKLARVALRNGHRMSALYRQLACLQD